MARVYGMSYVTKIWKTKPHVIESNDRRWRQVRKCDDVVYCKRDCDHIRFILNSAQLQTADCQFMMSASQPWGWSDYFIGACQGFWNPWKGSMG